jgi:hypothetical protein
MLSQRAGTAALSLAAALALLGGTPLDGFAQTAAAAEEDPAASAVVHALPPIQIHISIARASENEGAVDPLARDIYEHLPAKFQSITLLEDRVVPVLLGEQAIVKLPNGGEVRLLAVAVHGGQLHLQLEMQDLVNTSMRLANSRAFYVGGVRLDADTLVFKLVPEFSAYIDKNAPRTAGIPSLPTVNKVNGKR